MSKKARRKKDVVIHPPHPVYGDLEDRASKSDREWFEAHPEATDRIRPYMVGEFQEHVPPTDHMVLVRQFAPGIRARMPLSPDMIELIEHGVQITSPIFERITAIVSEQRQEGIRD